jgi:enolase-phosphatase E1
MPVATRPGEVIMTIRAIVTDIEGTTSSISFVHEVLFPYASRELPQFIRANHQRPEIAGLLDDVRREAAETDASTDRVVDILLHWIKEDRKATSLKALQGHIWRNGYESGDFKGHMYDDAVAYLRRWSEQGLRLFVYSSGSVAAQQLLFGFSDAGDLRPLFEGYFDTQIGHKKHSDSYAAIADSIGLPAGEILFLSDVAEELDAAQAAGMRTCQLVRDDDVAVGSHRIAAGFDEVIIGRDS